MKKLPKERKGRSGDLLSDLDVFDRLCRRLKDLNDSFLYKEVARAMQMEPTTLQSCISRLNKRLGYPVVQSEARKKNTVSSEGKVLLGKARSLLEQAQKLRETRKNTVTFCASNSLLLYWLPSAIKRFLVDEPDARLTVEGNWEMEEGLRRIKAREFGFAVVWDLKGREEKAKLSELSYFKFPRKFDYVVICGHGHPFARKLEDPDPSKRFVRLEDLKKCVLLTLGDEHQPLIERLPFPDRDQGGDRQKLVHFADLIAYIRAGHCGVAVIPSIVREFDFHRKYRELVHVPLNVEEKIQVAAIFVGHSENPDPKCLADYHLGDMDEATAELLKNVEKSFQDNHSSLSGWDVIYARAGVAAAFARLRTFSFLSLFSSSRIGLDRPEWRRGVLRDVREMSDKTSFSLSATIVLEDEPEKMFLVRAELIGKRVIQLRVESQHSHEVFVVSINTSDKSGKLECLIGVWSGEDLVGNPIAGPFVLSTSRLDHETLIERNWAAMLRVLVNPR